MARAVARDGAGPGAEDRAPPADLHRRPHAGLRAGLGALEELSTTSFESDEDGETTPVFTVLVVCTANICRSPMAEHLLRDALDAGRAAATVTLPAFTVSSAGVRGWTGAEMDPAAAVELRRLGGDPSAFRARDLSAVDLSGTDLILTATREHRSSVLQETPKALRRTFTLLELAHLVGAADDVVRRQWGSPHRLVAAASSTRGAATLTAYDVADPHGGSAEIHAAAATTVHEAVLVIARALTASGSA